MSGFVSEPSALRLESAGRRASNAQNFASAPGHVRGNRISDLELPCGYELLNSLKTRFLLTREVLIGTCDAPNSKVLVCVTQ